MPPLELGVFMRIGAVPVVLGRLNDPSVVRGALETAVQSARTRPGSAGITDSQEIRLLGELLRQMTSDVPA